MVSKGNFVIRGPATTFHASKGNWMLRIVTVIALRDGQEQIVRTQFARRSAMSMESVCRPENAHAMKVGKEFGAMSRFARISALDGVFVPLQAIAGVWLAGKDPIVPLLFALRTVRVTVFVKHQELAHARIRHGLVKTVGHLFASMDVAAMDFVRRI
jgi:hypothetical protein